MLDIIIALVDIIIFIKKSRGNFTFFQRMRKSILQFFQKRKKSLDILD